MKLGEIAEILRCQVYRQQAAENHQGQLLELTPEDFETVSGLVFFTPKEPTSRITVSLNSRSGKFILQQNDILLRMIGGLESIGSACFMAENPKKPVIPSKSLLLVRPNLKIIDPVWLFYRLSQDDIKKRLQKGAIEAKPRYITRETIRNLEIDTPTDAAIEATHRTHKKFLEDLWILRNKQENERQEWQKLAEIIAV